MSISGLPAKVPAQNSRNTRAQRSTLSGGPGAAVLAAPSARPTSPAIVALVATLAVVAGGMTSGSLGQAIAGRLPSVSTASSHDDATPASTKAKAAGAAFTTGTDGTLHVSAAGLHAVVRRSGLEVRTSATAAPVSVTAASIGRGGDRSVLPTAAPVASDTTTTAVRGPVVEWVHSQSGALEQGWTIADRPAGTGPLSLGLAITGAPVKRTSRTSLGLGSHIDYTNLAVRDATGTTLPARFMRTPGGADIVVRDSHATYPLVIDPNLSAVSTLDPPLNGGGSAFGDSVSISGRWMAVGEQSARLNPDPTVAQGRVDVFHDTTGNGTWSQVATLTTPASFTGAFALGSKVKVIVEAAGVTVFAQLNSTKQVLVWTFAGDPETAAPTATPVFLQAVSSAPITNGAVGGFGAALDAGGDTLVVGAPNSTTSGIRAPIGYGGSTSGAPVAINEQIGTAQIFRRSGGFGTTYSFVTRIDPANGINTPVATRDIAQNFGTSIAYDAVNGLIAVGAPGDDGVQTPTGGTSASPAAPGTSTNNGAVDMFRLSGPNTWTLTQRLAPSDLVNGSYFGTSVALTGPSGGVVAGAPQTPNGAAAFVGSAYLFDYDSGATTWSQTQRFSADIPTTTTNEGVAGGQLGITVASNPAGTRIYLGAMWQTPAGVNSQGTVHVYQRAGASGAATFLTHLDPITASDTHGGIGMAFGSALSVGSNTVAIGADGWGEATATLVGSVATFRDAGTTYDSAQELRPVEHRYGERFGYQIAQDGDVMAVSMPGGYHGSGYGVGAVGLYDRSPGGGWTLEKVMFPDAGNYTATDHADNAYGYSLALHVFRDASGHDIGLALAIGNPDASVINPGAVGTLAAQTISHTGNVGIWVRNGGPGTLFAHNELFAGGQTQTAANPGDYSNALPNAYFGWSVAFTGDGSLIVGEPGDTDTHADKIERFEGTKTSATSWTHQETIVDPTYVSAGNPGNDEFGLRVAADGSNVAVESYAPDGHAVISRYTDGGPSTNLSYQSAFDSAVDGTYGTQLAVSGNRIAVSSVIASATERVGIYRMVGNTAVREALLQPEPGDDGGNRQFGEALDFNHGGSVTTLAVGADGADSGTSGQAFVYVAQKKADGSATWSRAATLVPTDSLPVVSSGVARRGFGASISNWPNNGGLAVGAPDAAINGTESGRVYTFDGSSIAPPPGPAAFVDVHAPPTMQVGASQLKTAGLPPSLLSQQAEGSIAAASLGSIDLSQAPKGTSVDASPLSSIPLSSIPLSSIPLSSIPLSSIPLSSIAGGWGSVLNGTPFAGQPLQSVVLSEVYNLPSVQALPLGALQLAGSPLSSIPLSSIALGATPLSAIPLDASSTSDPITQWCAALTRAHADVHALGLDCSNPSNPDNDAVTMLSIGLKGAPMSSIPLSSIPLSSIPLSSIPLSSIPLSSIGLKGSPLSSIPLSSIPLSSIPLSSIPLSSIPLSSIPLSSIPLSSISLGGTPLSSIPLSSIAIGTTPLSSIPLSSIPLSSIPLSSIPLSSIPLSSIPLSSIPLSSISIAGSPLSSIPLSSIAIGTTPLSSIPLSSIPLSSIPLSSIPLSSIPLSSIPLSSIPLSSISIAGSPLSSIPLSSIAIGTTPLSSIPLSSIAADQRATLVDCTTFECSSTRSTLGEAASAGALLPGARLSDLGALLTGMRLSDLIGARSGITPGQLQSALGARSLAELSGFDTLKLGELPNIWPYLTLGQIQGELHGARLGDLSFTDLTRQQLINALTDSTLTMADVHGWDNVTLGAVSDVLGNLTLGQLGGVLSGVRLGDLAGVIQAGSGAAYTVDDLKAALHQAMPNADLGDISHWDNVTIGELGAYGDTTIGQLFGALNPDETGQFTLGELLLTLINPKQYPWDSLDMSTVGAQALDQHPTGASITVGYRADAPDGLPRTVELTVELPTGSRLDPDTIHATWTGSPSESTPVVDGDTATWTFTNVPAGADQSLTFDLQAPLTIGPASIKATALLTADDAIAADTANTTVHEAFEPNDTIAVATPLPDDTIVLSHVSQANDLDVYKFDISQPGTRVSIDLSNLDADLDIVLYAPRDGSITPPGSRTLDPIEDDGSTAAPAQQGGAVAEQPTAGNDVQAPTDLGSLAVTQASLNRGRADEQIDTGVLTRTGTYYLAVSGYNGAVDRKPYALRLKRFESTTQPACPARTVTPGTVGTQLPSTLPAGTNTVFVVNQSRMSGLFGPTAAGQLMADLANYRTWLTQHASLGITPAVLTIDADQGVHDAYAAWDASPCLVSGANGVVSEITRLLNGYRQQGSQIKNVVIVGGDDAVPFARVPDRTTVANETGYASTFSDAGNALYATFASSSVQTDNAYVDRSPYAFGDRTLYVPDTSIGRLVESPTEISAQLTDYENAGGKLAVNTGLVTGYDFLTDGAHAVAHDAASTYHSVDTHLISEGWTRQQLQDAIASIKPNLLSINSHFDHFRALPGAGNTTGDESDLFTAAAVRGALNGDLAGSVVFSMGCHSGLSASDGLVPSGDSRALDFAQAVSGQGGVFVGNTGFGYGDTDTVALSEQLMDEFAQRLNGSMSVGEALLYAKNSYFSSLAAFTPYDEKVLQEATFYGLPFYRLDVPNPPALPALPTPTVVPDPVTGLDSSTDHIVPTFVNRSADNGTTYVAARDSDTGHDSLTTVQDRPVEPKVDDQFALPAGQTSHDALVTGLTSVDNPGTDPYVFQPVVDSSGERSDVGVDTAFPTKPVEVNPALTPSGDAYDVAATTGYFRTTAADGSGIQRNYHSVDVTTYFAGSDDFTAPTFSAVTADAHGNTLTVTAHVMDDRGGPDRVKRVYLLALIDPRPGVATTWEHVDLVRTTGTDEWTGTVPANGTHIEYTLQAVDAAGNVAVTSDKATNFVETGTGGSTGGTGSPLAVEVTGPQGMGGWFTGPATVTATGGSGLSYEIVGEQDPAPYNGPVQVSSTATVLVRSEDGQVQSVTIPIDDVGPVAHLSTPAAAQLVSAQAGLTIDFSCDDAGSGTEPGSGITSCTAKLDGNPVSNGAALHPSVGTHSVTVTAGPDVAGNSPSVPTVTHTFTVIAAPTVGTIGVSKTQDGSPTTITVPFTGSSAVSYTVSVTWGDGAQVTCAPGTPGCTLTRTASGGGTLTVSHTYAAPAANSTVTATATDQLGQSGSNSIVVNRATSLTATAALLQLNLSGNVVLKGGAISATLKANGSPLAGQMLKFTLPDGTAICTATTDSTGTARCPSSLVVTLQMLIAGRYAVTFPGKDVYKGSTASASLIG